MNNHLKWSNCLIMFQGSIPQNVHYFIKQFKTTFYVIAVTSTLPILFCIFLLQLHYFYNNSLPVDTMPSLHFHFRGQQYLWIEDEKLFLFSLSELGWTETLVWLNPSIHSPRQFLGRNSLRFLPILIYTQGSWNKYVAF